MRKINLLLILCALSTVIQAQYTLTIDDVSFSDGVITQYIRISNKDIIIPDNFDGVAVTSIGSHAFSSTYLTSVIFPVGLTSIDDNAFLFNYLTSVTFPEGLISIGDLAFDDNQLSSVTFSDGLTSIGDAAFSGNQLSSVTLPDEVTVIGEGAFYGNQLTSFSLPGHYQGYSDTWYDSNGETYPIGTTISNVIYSYTRAAENFVITYNLDGGTNDTNPTTYTIETTTITMAAATKEGYTFVGWYSEAAFTNQISEIPKRSTGDVALFAKFLITHDITYTLDGGVNDGANPATYTVEDDIILISATKEGYIFEGWYSEAAFTNQITEIANGSTEDVALFAKFDAVAYDITYTLDGGTNDPTNPATYTVEGQTITLSAAVKEGYTFEDWYSEADFTNQITEIAKGSIEDVALFAKFDAVAYDITYTLDGGTNASNPASYTVETATITLTTATKAGYTFEGWYSEADFTNQITEIANGSIGTLALFAKFSIILGVEIENKNAFSFYPNPSADFIYTDSKISNLKVKVVNLSGVTVQQFETSASSYDISSLAVGIYTIVAIDAQGVIYTSKLIKK